MVIKCAITIIMPGIIINGAQMRSLTDDSEEDSLKLRSFPFTLVGLLPPTLLVRVAVVTSFKDAVADAVAVGDEDETDVLSAASARKSP